MELHSKEFSYKKALLTYPTHFLENNSSVLPFVAIQAFLFLF
jgi:hypothetical protein